MAAATRIYLIADPKGAPLLVQASTPAQALRHATSHYTVRVATALDVARLLVNGGAKVEVAGDHTDGDTDKG